MRVHTLVCSEEVLSWERPGGSADSLPPFSDQALGSDATDRRWEPGAGGRLGLGRFQPEIRGSQTAGRL